MSAHRRRRAQGALIAPDEPTVVLGLELDLSLQLVGHRLRGQVEEQDTRFPPRFGPLDADLVYAPASLLEDALRGLHGA